MPLPRDHHPWHAAIYQKLGDIVAASSIPPPWQAAWLGLRPNATDEERLAVYQAVRTAGSVPAAAGCFLVAWLLDGLTDHRAEEGLREFEARLATVRQQYGLEEDASAESDDAPPEYRKTMQQMNDAWDALYLATLEEYGEHELARLFRTDPDQFDQLYETGRRFFHPDDGDDEGETDWLDLLLDMVSSCVEADSPMGPLELRYCEEEQFWEVTIHPTPVELVGGRHDGEVVMPGITLDLEQLRAAFDSIVAFGWNALGLHWPEGPHVYVEGVFQGREVYLQVLAYPPTDEEPGLKLNAPPKTRRRDG
jgi:hypothetical protein